MCICVHLWLNDFLTKRKYMNDEKIVLVARLKVKDDKIEEAKQAALAISCGFACGRGKYQLRYSSGD